MKFPLAYPSLNRRVLKTLIFTTLSVGPWVVPSDWMQAGSKVQCWAAGGATGVSANTNPSAGGGGAYSESSNLPFVPGASLNFNIGVATLGMTTAGVAPQSGPTWIGGTTLATSTVGAEGGKGGSGAGGAGGLGGQAANGQGQIKFSGGQGATGSGAGACGGGAAGPFGDGANGTNAIGGQGDNGQGGLGGATATTSGAPANPGQPGQECVAGAFLVGSGGGGGGRSVIVSIKGATGGAFGGAGGSPRTTGTVAGGDGYNGLMVITYMGLAAPVTPSFATISATGAQAFTIPEYNSITFYLWGGGASGCSATSNLFIGKDGNDSTIAQFGIIAGAGQCGSATTTAVGGLGGTASGGDTNTPGNQGGGAGSATGDKTGKGGDAPNQAKGGGTGGIKPATSNTAGNPGTPFGAGGSTATSANWGPGGGSGGHVIKTFNRGDFGAPVPGSTVNFVIGAGGLSGSGSNASGLGGDGGARIEWS